MEVVGVRVVRGPDWEWGNQDGGEGCVGTVVEIGKPGSNTTPDKTVVIQWDVGSRTNYRTGYQGAYDLRVWDNATLGVKHSSFICDSCKCQDIAGMRWRCESCNDFDLCSQCFMSDKHDLSHYFLRFDTPNNPSVRILPRSMMTKVEVKGMFVGAKVIRGHDWDWKDQDGGIGSQGIVLDIRGWENESARSVANVQWANGTSNVYRIGHNGKTDLKAISIVGGGFYYREALAILGNSKPPTLPVHDAHPSSETVFSVGDRVQVAVDEGVLREMQQGHGGWNPRMNQCLNAIGVVHRVTERGDVRVQFSGMNQRWTFHPKALRRLPPFVIGQTIQIIDNVEKMKQLQLGHGEWVDDMNLALGKFGKIIKVYQDGDLRVTVDGQTWTLNPLCCINKSKMQPNSEDATTNQGLTGSNQDALQHQEMKREKPIADTLVSASSHGNINIVQEILLHHPSQVDVKLHGKTSLLVAAHQGHLEVVQYLISKSARLDLTDDDGDTVLHYAVFGNQPKVIKLLLDKSIDVNMRNNVMCTPLHVAVNKQFINCVRLLLQNGADVNAQDTYGDTALHDAIGKGDTDIIDELTSASSANFTLRNKRGFNVLHYAALKGNFHATTRLLARCVGLVNLKKDDGFTALHLASLNGHFEIASMLINEGKCEVDPLNNRNQTPLFLAVSQGHATLIELLITAGANVGITDADGDTVLHVACLRLRTSSGEPSATLCPRIYQMQQSILASGGQNCDSLSLAIACFLVQVGCNLSSRNRKNKTCEDIVDDETIWGIIKSHGRESQVPLRISDTKPFIESTTAADSNLYDSNLHTVTESSECIVCSEVLPRIRFMPCRHEIACFGCARRMKKCLKCHITIEEKLNAENSPIYESVDQRNLDRIKYLESRVAEMEEAYICSICMERRRNVVFLCGHGACDRCSSTLRTCHMCRKLIARKINLY